MCPTEQIKNGTVKQWFGDLASSDSHISLELGWESREVWGGEAGGEVRDRSMDQMVSLVCSQIQGCESVTPESGPWGGL